MSYPSRPASLELKSGRAPNGFLVADCGNDPKVPAWWADGWVERKKSAKGKGSLGVLGVYGIGGDLGDSGPRSKNAPAIGFFCSSPPAPPRRWEVEPLCHTFGSTCKACHSVVAAACRHYYVLRSSPRLAAANARLTTDGERERESLESPFTAPKCHAGQSTSGA